MLTDSRLKMNFHYSGGQKHKIHTQIILAFGHFMRELKLADLQVNSSPVRQVVNA